ncbi:MAG: acyl-CoA dehydrogenase family protein [Pseudomonadales bacterium]|jgi:alkylation response protein AidB-like acyl-CoA dehydrogenase
MRESAEAIVGRFEDAAAIAAANADRAEREERLTDSTVSALLRAGVARLYLPAGLGGLEVDPLTCAAVTERIARADAAAGWFVMVANSAKILAAGWPESLVAEVLGDDPDVVVAASGNRPFTGRPAGGDVIVSGVNSFVSGCHHARWLLSTIVVDGEFLSVLLPMAECEIVDNWHALGMRGTGSNDVRADHVRVPAGHVVRMPTPGEVRRNRYYSSPLYLCPGRIVFATYVPVTLVLAERAIELLDELAEGKTPYAETSKLKHRSIAQIKAGRALATFRSGRALFREALAETWDRARRGEEASPQNRADLYLAGTHAVQSAALVVRLVADAAGSSIIYRDNPLERIVRDMETLRHHGFVNESRYGSVSQLRWGAELDYPLLLR